MGPSFQHRARLSCDAAVAAYSLPNVACAPGGDIPLEYIARDYASRLYDSVSSIDVDNVRDSVKGSLKSASGTISNYWNAMKVTTVQPFPL